MPTVDANLTIDDNGTQRPMRVTDLAVQGKSIRNGAGPPTDGSGTFDEFYVDTTAWAIYGPKTDAGWGAGVSLVGPSGASTIAGITGLQAALNALQPTSEKGQANGYASLDSGGKVPAGQLPAAGTGGVFTVAQGPTGAPHAQLGPTTKTLHSGTGGTFSGVLAFQNDATDAPDEATRIYIVPRAKPTTGTVGGALKIFGDPYFNGAEYRDMGLYFSRAQNGDTGYWGQGVMWLNGKVGPDQATATTYWGKNPDIGFSFQDGLTVGGRFTYLSDGNGMFTAGPNVPRFAPFTSAVRAEIQGDIGFNDGTNGGAGKGIRWFSAAGLANNLIQFNNTDVKWTLAGTQVWRAYGNGSVVHGNETGVMATNSTDGFFYVRAMTGPPTGVPTTRAGSTAIVVESSGTPKIWAYVGGAWKSATLA